jgi:hypothetical protein
MSKDYEEFMDSQIKHKAIKSETTKTDDINLEALSNKLKEAEDRIKILEERQKVHRYIISYIKDFVGITKK